VFIARHAKDARNLQHANFVERELILSRTSEGRVRDVSSGVKFGRPSKLSGYQRNAALSIVLNCMALVDVARLFSVSPATICVMVKEHAHV